FAARRDERPPGGGNVHGRNPRSGGRRLILGFTPVAGQRARLAPVELSRRADFCSRTAHALVVCPRRRRGVARLGSVIDGHWFTAGAYLASWCGNTGISAGIAQVAPGSLCARRYRIRRL